MSSLLKTMFLVIFCSLLSANLKAEEAGSPEHVEGWIEAVAIVRDLERAQAFFTDIAGYQIIHSGSVAKPIVRLWTLEESVSGKEVLLAEPGAKRGFVRLVELSGLDDQIEARSAGQFFDTGGIMGLNTRVYDIDLTFRNLQAAGWRPLSNPVRFSVEGFSVAEAIFQGPDGLVIGLIEREQPPLGPEWTMQPGKLSRPNNAFVSSADIQRDLDFYETSLGWSTFLRDQGKAAKAGMNLYGWPHNLVESISRDVAWVHPSGGEGSIALMGLGVEGRDFSSTAKAPNYGWVALRTWTQPTKTEPLEKAGKAFVLEPYGCVFVTKSTDPGGVQIEQLTPSNGCY